jgi:hypothetical protein
MRIRGNLNGNMKYSVLICMAMAVAFIDAEAQEPVVNGNDAAISKGIQVDNPSLLLSWGAPVPQDTAYHLKIRRIFKVMTIVEWDTVKVFDMPMDSVFLHYVTPNRPQTMQWQGFHSIDLFFEPGNTDRMKAIFEHFFGPPKTSRSKQGQFVHIWQTARFYAFISNRKRYGALNGHVNAYIGIPHYLR